MRRGKVVEVIREGIKENKERGSRKKRENTGRDS